MIVISACMGFQRSPHKRTRRCFACRKCFCDAKHGRAYLGARPCIMMLSPSKTVLHGARPCIGFLVSRVEPKQDRAWRSTAVHHGGVLKLDRAWRSTAVLRVSTGKQAPIFGFQKSCTGVLKVSTAVLRREQAPISGFQKSSTGVLRVSTAVLRALVVCESNC